MSKRCIADTRLTNINPKTLRRMPREGSKGLRFKGKEVKYLLFHLGELSDKDAQRVTSDYKWKIYDITEDKETDEGFVSLKVDQGVNIKFY